MSKVKEHIIPEGWSTSKISKVFDFLPTNSFSRNDMGAEGSESSIYNIHYGDIHTIYKEPILDFAKETVPVLNEGLVVRPVELLKDGDIVIADASEDYEGVGETVELKNLNGKKAVAGLHTLALRDKSGETVNGFRAYLFNHPATYKAIRVIATGSKVYGISKTNVAKLDVVLPPLPEQRKIVTILSTWDKAIEKQEQLIAQKEQCKKGLMQQLLTGRLRLSKSDGEKCTDEWKEVKLGEVIKDYKLGGNYSNSTEVTEKPLIKMGNLGRGFIKLDKLEFIPNDVDVDPKDKIRIDDLFFNTRNTLELVGKVAIWRGELDIAYYNSNLMWMKFDSNVYMNYCLNSFNGRKELKRIAIGTTSVAAIYTRDLLKVKLRIPELGEQQKIASVLSAADKEIQALNKELIALKEQKRGLMQKLLTGEVRVKV